MNRHTPPRRIRQRSPSPNPCDKDYASTSDCDDCDDNIYVRARRTHVPSCTDGNSTHAIPNLYEIMLAIMIIIIIAWLF